MGVGVYFVNDCIGSCNWIVVYVDISFLIRVNKCGDWVVVGLSGGVDFFFFNFIDLNVKDVNDLYYGQ